MFKRKPTQTAASVLPDAAPGDFSQDTSKKAFDKGSRAEVERNRWFVVSVILALAILAHGASMNFVFPLKQTETVVVRSAQGGRMTADGEVVGTWAPNEEEIGYFLNEWARKVYDINQATINGTIAESAGWVIGNAVDQLRALRQKENPLILLKNNPSLIRTYEFTSLNFGKNNSAVLRFSTTTRSNGTVQSVIPMVMYITYTQVKPTSRALAMKHPAGLYVSSFDVDTESKKSQ